MNSITYVGLQAHDISKLFDCNAEALGSGTLFPGTRITSSGPLSPVLLVVHSTTRLIDNRPKKKSCQRTLKKNRGKARANKTASQKPQHPPSPH